MSEDRASVVQPKEPRHTGLFRGVRASQKGHRDRGKKEELRKKKKKTLKRGRPVK